MDLQAQLALKGVRIQDFYYFGEGDAYVTFTYKWVMPSGEVRWDHGFMSFQSYVGGSDECDRNLAGKILRTVDGIRESLKDKTPEVL